MPLNNPHTSLTASEFYSSGIPFVYTEEGPFTITFKYVTRAITVCVEAYNVGNTIHFDDAGATAMVLPVGVTRLEVRCKKIVVLHSTGMISVCAEMSRVPAGTLRGPADHPGCPLAFAKVLHPRPCVIEHR